MKAAARALRASSKAAPTGTTRATRPRRSASAAVSCSPVRMSSMALDFPTARMSRCVPPTPGIVPNLISGCPNLASCYRAHAACAARAAASPSERRAEAGRQHHTWASAWLSQMRRVRVILAQRPCKSGLLRNGPAMSLHRRRRE